MKTLSESQISSIKKQILTAFPTLKYKDIKIDSRYKTTPQCFDFVGVITKYGYYMLQLTPARNRLMECEIKKFNHSIF